MPDNAHFARKYAEISEWQYRRGLKLLEAAAPTPGSTVLDLGCGTGKLALDLARRVGQSGTVLAVDPDVDRLLEASAATPGNIQHISFQAGKGQDLHFVADTSIDLVFSNYAVHWVIDHEAMLREVERILKPGGRFVAEFLGVSPKLFVEMVLHIPDREHHPKENMYHDDLEWRALVAARAFDVVGWQWLDLTLEFDSLATLYDWLEGTSGGRFEEARLPPEAAASYAAQFPGPVSVPITSFRMVLRRQ